MHVSLQRHALSFRHIVERHSLPPPMPNAYTLAYFDYALPTELIAQSPAPSRSGSRLLHVAGLNLTDLRFTDLPALLQPGDLLVFNDTRVIHARIRGRKPTGGDVEILVERITGPTRAVVQLKASHPPRPGGAIELADGARGRGVARRALLRRAVRGHRRLAPLARAPWRSAVTSIHFPCAKRGRRGSLSNGAARRPRGGRRHRVASRAGARIGAGAVQGEAGGCNTSRTASRPHPWPSACSRGCTSDRYRCRLGLHLDHDAANRTPRRFGK